VWISKTVAVLVGLVGLALILQSYRLEGFDMEWRASAGVAALAYAYVTLVVGSLVHARIARHRVIGGLVTVAVSALVLVEAAHGHGTWLGYVSLELGVTLAFVAALEFLVAQVVHGVQAREREDGRFYDNMALATGLFTNLSLFQYYGLRFGLDELTPTLTPDTMVERVALLLRLAPRAAALDPRQTSMGTRDFQEGIRRELDVLHLTTDAAKRFRLSDAEFEYLAAVINVRSRPNRPRGEPIEEDLLPQVVENSAELIVKRRLDRWLFFSRPWDPLAALDEMDR
jgi:hypothetical protein